MCVVKFGVYQKGMQTTAAIKQDTGEIKKTLKELPAETAKAVVQEMERPMKEQTTEIKDHIASELDARLGPRLQEDAAAKQVIENIQANIARERIQISAVRALVDADKTEKKRKRDEKRDEAALEKEEKAKAKAAQPAKKQNLQKQGR